MAQSNAHTMHALLAAAALHIRLHSSRASLSQPPPPDLLAALRCKHDEFAVVEAGHHLSATAGFRAALENLAATTDVDPLLTTCMMLNMLSFAGLPGPQEAGRQRWPFPGYGGERPLGWIRILLGFGPLLGGLSAGVKRESRWMSFFEKLGHEVFYDERGGREGLPDVWAEFWGVDEGSTCDEHPYLRVVRRLALIMRLWRESHGKGDVREHDRNATRYLQFMQGVDESFIVRLERRDMRALVVYGFFMAILTYPEHWWCRSRAVRECTAVVRYLDEYHGAEVAQWLGFMADAVGYKTRTLLAYGSMPEILD
jgi:hypothetical protein